MPEGIKCKKKKNKQPIFFRLLQNASLKLCTSAKHHNENLSYFIHPCIMSHSNNLHSSKWILFSFKEFVCRQLKVKQNLNFSSWLQLRESCTVTIVSFSSVLVLAKTGLIFSGSQDGDMAKARMLFDVTSLPGAGVRDSLPGRRVFLLAGRSMMGKMVPYCFIFGVNNFLVSYLLLLRLLLLLLIFISHCYFQ